MVMSVLCDYSHAFIFAKGTITVVDTTAQGQANNGTNKKGIFNNCAPFINCISRANNTQVDDASCINVVMPIYNLIE